MPSPVSSSTSRCSAVCSDFAEFDPAARQGVKTVARRAGAPHQEDLAVAKDRAGDGELGTGRLNGGGQGGIRLIYGSKFRGRIMPDRDLKV